MKGCGLWAPVPAARCRRRCGMRRWRMEKRSKYFGLNSSDQIRAQMAHTGKSRFGDWIWTPQEEQAVHQFYPDFKRLKRLLRRRSMIAIQQRAIHLRILKRDRVKQMWTANEISKLRRRYRDATKEELISEFPRHTWKSIRCKAAKLGVRRRCWQPKKTGKPVLDEIRNRAADLHITLADLDRICFAGRYFRESSRGTDPSRNLLLRAVAALGGRVEIVWR